MPRVSKTPRGGKGRGAPARPSALSVLQEVYSILAGEPEVEGTLRHVVEKVVKALRADVCAFLLFDDKTRELVTQPGGWGVPRGAEASVYRVAVNDPLTSSGRVFLSREPMLCEDAWKDPRVNPRFAKLWNYRSLIVAPLTVGERSIGVLRVGQRKPGRFGKDDLDLAVLVAEQAAVVVENARLYQRVRDDVKELQRLSEVKSQFLSMVSHDLLSPISSVEGFLSLLLREEVGSLSDRQRNFLTLCEKSLARVTSLIDDLLDHSRIEAGAVKMRPEALDLSALLAAVHQDHAAAAAEKRISFTVKEAPGLRLTADPLRLRQVLDNLVRNALKFTPEGGRVALSARREEGEAVVSVKDTGIGLSDHERQRVFDRYYQVEKNVSRRARSAGLGLAICKSLIEHHGGRIWVDSAAGRGSDFQFSLPLK